MRTYQLYLIGTEFAAHYFGREHMFYQLFQEYHESTEPMKTILAKQILYITKPIQTLKVHQNINMELQRKKSFRAENSTYYIEIGKKSFAKLQVQDRYLTLHAWGHYDAETIFFEVLRKSESSYLAIDIEHERYGWLKPIKERKFV